MSEAVETEGGTDPGASGSELTSTGGGIGAAFAGGADPGSSSATESESGEAPAWAQALLAEGVDLEQVALPDGVLGGKYKNVGAAMRAISELTASRDAANARLKGLTGAPTAEDGSPAPYEFTFPETLQNEAEAAGVELSIDKADPFYQAVEAWAREAGLSQDAFSALFGLYSEREWSNQPSLAKTMRSLSEYYGGDRARDAKVQELDRHFLPMLQGDSEGQALLQELSRDEPRVMQLLDHLHTGFQASRVSVDVVGGAGRNAAAELSEIDTYLAANPSAADRNAKLQRREELIAAMS